MSLEEDIKKRIAAQEEAAKIAKQRGEQAARDAEEALSRQQKKAHNLEKILRYDETIQQDMAYIQNVLWQGNGMVTYGHSVVKGKPQAYIKLGHTYPDEEMECKVTGHTPPREIFAKGSSDPIHEYRYIKGVGDINLTIALASEVNTDSAHWSVSVTHAKIKKETYGSGYITEECLLYKSGDANTSTRSSLELGIKPRQLRQTHPDLIQDITDFPRIFRKSQQFPFGLYETILAQRFPILEDTTGIHDALVTYGVMVTEGKILTAVTAEEQGRENIKNLTY